MKKKQPKNFSGTPYVAIAYVALVLGIDLLDTFGSTLGLDWAWLRRAHSSAFDWYKFIFWLIIPLMLTVPRLDWQYFSVRRWKRVDVMLLIALISAGAIAILVIPKIPELNAIYRSQAHLPVDQKWIQIQRYLWWYLSWLLGWEFLHRYFLLRPVSTRWPVFGWLLVPLSEGLYHVPKSVVEAAGMTLFSIVATQWTLRRKNLLLPLIAHAAIEIALLFWLFA